MSIKLALPKVMSLKPRITVIGVGGAGGNAINNMIASGLDGVEFIAANTDAQALEASSAEYRIQLGVSLTEGLGAGSKPEIGEAAAVEAVEEIRSRVAGSHMVFVAAGMGGGTGTGAAAVIARTAKEEDILTVGIVTKPFQFEGARRMRIAEAGIEELKKYVDTLIVIPNQNLFRIANEKTTFAEAFILADQVLYSGIACIVDLIVKDGLINLDFADVRTIMSGMGTAMMGTGEGSGDRRAVIAAEEAISNPLLDDITLRGARGLLLSITGGRNLTLYEVDEAASRVRQEVDPEANIIVGATFDDALGDRVRVSIVASGMNRSSGEMPNTLDSEAWVRDRLGASPGAGRSSRQPEPLGMPTASAASAPPVPEPVAPPGPTLTRPAPPGPMLRPTPPPTPSASVPQRPATAASAEIDDDELRRRLTAAFDYGDDGVAEAPEPESEASYATGSTPAGEPWQAMGDVTIEEGPPQLHGLAGDPPPSRVPHPQPASPPPAERPVPATGFSPAAPADIRRPPRRMPDLDEFPAVGQREYRARTAASESAQGDERSPPATARTPSSVAPVPRASAPAARQPQPAPAPQRRPGLFERLTGRRGAEPAPGGGTQDGRAQDDAELPVFFNRGPK